MTIVHYKIDTLRGGEAVSACEKVVETWTQEKKLVTCDECREWLAAKITKRKARPTPPSVRTDPRSARRSGLLYILRGGFPHEKKIVFMRPMSPQNESESIDVSRRPILIEYID